MSDQIRAQMQRLPEPAPPAGFDARVMARIAREADGVLAVRRHERASSPTGWIGTIAGTALAFAAILWGWSEAGVSLRSLVLPDGGINTPWTPSHLPAMALLLFGLLCYLAGLFAPLRNPRRR
jgi:hypothetical protein